MSFVNKINKLLTAPEETSSVVFIDEKGATYTVEEAIKRGVKGSVTRTQPTNNKDEVAALIWDKKRVGIADLKDLDNMVKNVIIYIAKNSAGLGKAKIKKEYPELFK